ncbi:hypothetical protein C7974DRAFT_456680, partial [Boeremia exigua]|uniref:uncharacterized protein n=1 Tax=Boeremia exigua TaxID=749465 RepID=UPI001E8D0D41
LHFHLFIFVLIEYLCGHVEDLHAVLEEHLITLAEVNASALVLDHIGIKCAKQLRTLVLFISFNRLDEVITAVEASHVRGDTRNFIDSNGVDVYYVASAPVYSGHRGNEGVHEWPSLMALSIRQLSIVKLGVLNASSKVLCASIQVVYLRFVLLRGPLVFFLAFLALSAATWRSSS